MGDEPLSRGRSLLVAGVACVVTALASGAVVLATDGADRRAPSPTPLPTGIDLRLQPAVPDDLAPVVFLVPVENRGEPVRVTAVRQVSPGYEAEADFPDLALRRGDVASLRVSLVLTCGAGIGVDPRPEIELDVIGATRGPTTIRLPLTRDLGLPEVLLAPCAAPLSAGARAAVTVLEPEVGDLRLRVDLTAGAGVLWLSSFSGLSTSFLSGAPPLPLVLAPGTSRRLDVEMQLEGVDCTALASAPDPLLLFLSLRTGPEAEQQQRELGLSELGGAAYRRAVAAVVARACP